MREYLIGVKGSALLAGAGSTVSGIMAMIGAFALMIVMSGSASAQTPGPGDIIPSTWAFSDLTGAMGAVASNELVKVTFFGLLGLSLLIVVATRLKRAIKAGK